jgi:hypothetical protein
MTQGRALTAASRARFIEVLSQTANVTASAAAINSHRNTVYDWRERDLEFAAAWDNAIEVATDALEAEARRRALEGVLEPVISQGRIVMMNDEPLYVRKYSDNLMLAQLRAHRPEKYRERTETRHVGVDDGPVKVEAVRSEIERRLAALAGTLPALSQVVPALPAPVEVQSQPEPTEEPSR